MSLSEKKTETQKQYPKEVILKDGTGVTIRLTREEDAQKIFEMFQRFSEEDRWFLDDDVSDRKLIDSRVKEINRNRFNSIVAQLEDRIIALGLLKREGHGSQSHIGTIVISVDPQFRENRLGTWVLLDLINLAMEMGLEKLMMSLVRDRDALVIRGVKGLDFFEEARFQDHAKDKDGQAHDLVVMTKRLFPRWGDF
jgi:L-amino acid N-acyltransferase YncA